MMIHQKKKFKKKLEYKCIYVLGYVHPNIVFKTLQQIYQIPLYINAKVYIWPNWQGLAKLANVDEANQLKK